MTTETTTQPPRLSAAKRLRAAIKAEYLLIPIVFVVITGLWELIVRVLEVPSFILPPPSEILTSLIGHLNDQLFWRHLWVTTQETLIGFAIGVFVALVLGVAISQVRLLEKTLMPYVVAFQTLPKVALAPLFVVWFGFGMLSKIVMAAVISFFPMLINIIEGLRSADAAQIEMLRSFGATRTQVFRMIRVPNAMPFFMAGLDIGIVFAILGAVVGEFIGAQEGLGYLLLQTNYNFDISGMFAILIVLSVMGILAHATITLARRKLTFWGQQEHTIGA